jgi:hypothetical protein
MKKKISTYEDLMSYKDYLFAYDTLYNGYENFAKLFKKYCLEINKNFKFKYFNKDNHYISAYMVNKLNNKEVFFQIDDVRFNQNSWIDNITLLDTTKKEYYSCTISDLPKWISKLLA